MGPDRPDRPAPPDAGAVSDPGPLSDQGPLSGQGPLSDQGPWSDPGVALGRLHAAMRRPAFNAWLGVQAVAADPVRRTVIVTMPLRPEMCHDPDQRLAHGGVVAALIDVAGYAAVSVWQDGATPTITLQVEYLAPATGPVLRAEGRLRKLGRSIGRADVEVFSGDRLVALGRGSFSTGGLAT